MRALVTGGAGFIGSHLAEALLARESEVTVLDDLSTGPRDNMLHLQHHPPFRFVQGSMLDAERVGDVMARCDEVYHLGAAVGVRLIFDHPVRTIETNVTGTEVILEAALRHGPRVFIARYFNPVGPRQTGAYGMVVPRLVHQVLTGRPLTIYGDGEQLRTFTWVGDAVRATIQLMETPAAVGAVFNIGSAEAITINDLARRIPRLTGSHSSIVHVPYEEVFGPGFEDARSRGPDISRLRQTIGYRPSLTLDEILERVIASTHKAMPRMV